MDPPALWRAPAKFRSDDARRPWRSRRRARCPGRPPLELPDQFGVEQARPRPDADPVDRRSVNRGHHDIAGGLSRLPGEPQVGQCVTKRIVPAARQDDCERNHHENMRPISFHVVTILVVRVWSSSGSEFMAQPLKHSANGSCCRCRCRFRCHCRCRWRCCHCRCPCRFRFRCRCRCRCRYCHYRCSIAAAGVCRRRTAATVLASWLDRQRRCRGLPGHCLPRRLEFREPDEARICTCYRPRSRVARAPTSQRHGRGRWSRDGRSPELHRSTRRAG